MSKGKSRDASPLVFPPSEQYIKSSPRMDASDAESVDQQFRFATMQLKEHFRIEDNTDTITPEGATSPSLQLSSHGLTSSSENEYMTPWKQPFENLHYFQDEIDVEDPLFRPQQKPSVMSGEVYFNFRDNLYRTLGKNEVIDSQSAIYHVGRDQCYYLSSNQMWKSVPLADFPPNTVFYWYRSGPLQIPDWPRRYSLLMPQIESPTVAFPRSAFKPVQPPGNSPINMPVAHPLPIQRTSPFQHRQFNGNLGDQEGAQAYPVWSRSPRQDLRTEIPNTFNSWDQRTKRNGVNMPATDQTSYPYSGYASQLDPHQHWNDISNMPVGGTRQSSSALTQEQQLEIDRQVAYRLQEIEVAQAHTKDDLPSKIQENRRQYTQNDVLQKQKKKQERKPTHVGFPQHQLSRQQEWQREPATVGSSSRQHIRQQDRYHQEHTGLPYKQWQRDPAIVGSSNHQREINPSRPWSRQQGESASVESPYQPQRTLHGLQQQYMTPLSHKPKRNKRNQSYNQRQTQHNWDPQMSSYNPQGYHKGQMRTLESNQQPRQNNYGQFNQLQHNQHQNWAIHNHRQFNQPWTSTPRDQNSRYNGPRSQSLFGDNTTNNSILNLLDIQCKVQQETTQALTTIIKLHDTRANDAFLSDLHSFSGKPDEFLKWIAAIERVANVTGRPARELAAAKAEGAVFKCLQGIPPSTDWEGCKKILRESFSNIQTKEHANSFLMGRCQRPNESLQEYIHVFTELAKITTGLEPKQITESMMITLFNKHLYNHHIKKQVCKRNHRTLQCAFDSAMKAEADAKKLEGLSDNNVSIMKDRD